MTQTEKTTLIQIGKNSGSIYESTGIGSIDIGSSEGDLFKYQLGGGCERLSVCIKNNTYKQMTVKFFTTEDETITSTHVATEWDQEPDVSTAYTVGSLGSAAGNRLKKILVGPFKAWKLRGYHTTVTSTGSVEVYWTSMW